MLNNLPVPAYPFEKKVHPAADSIRIKAADWIDEYRCLPPPVREEIRQGEFEYLACCFFPDADEALLEIIARYNIWVFIYDDLYGPMPAETLEQSCQRATDILHGAPLTKADNEIMMALKSIRDDLLPYTTSSWMQRFITDQGLHFKAMLADTAFSYKAEVRYPAVREYVALRELLVAAYPDIDFIELISGFVLPLEIITHPVIKRVRQLTSRLIGWYNDFISWKKEIAANEAMNLLLVIRNERGSSLVEAHAVALEMHDTALQEFLSIGSHLPDFGSCQQQVQDYITALGLMVQGHALWYTRTKRYV